MQSLFQHNTGLLFRLILFTVLSIALMILDHRDDRLGAVRENITSYLVYPLQFVVDIPTRVIGWGNETMASRNTLITQNKALQSKNMMLQAQLQRLESIEQENERLRKLLGSTSRTGEKKLVAEILTVDQDPYKKQIIINKGKIHRVYAGQAVIDASGIMGQITQLSLYSSTTLLISDPSHSLPVQTNRAGVRATAQGTGNTNELELLYIPNNADIKEDDLVVTSGLAGRFPVNYPVARISEIKILPGETFAKVKARPTAALDKSREVLLIWPSDRSTP